MSLLDRSREIEPRDFSRDIVPRDRSRLILGMPELDPSRDILDGVDDFAGDDDFDPSLLNGLLRP